MMNKKRYFLIIFISFLYGNDAKPYGPLGIWSKNGLSVSGSHGFFSQPGCVGDLFQWDGKVSYAYTENYSGVGYVQLRGGRIEGGRSIASTQYYGAIHRNFDFEKAFIGIGMGLGFGSTSLSSADPEEEPDLLCPDFTRDNEAGAMTMLSGSYNIYKSFWLTSYGRYGVSYSGKFIDESGLGLALDLKYIWPDFFKGLSGVFFFQDLVGHYKNNFKESLFDLNYHVGFGIRM